MVKDEGKTKKQLIDELVRLRKRVNKLEAWETERKQAEQELRKSKTLFQKIFDAQQDAIFILDSAMPPRIIDCNSATSRVFGYDRQAMLDRTTEFLHVDAATFRTFQERLYPAIAERGFLDMFEFRMTRKDGTVFPTEHSIVPLEDEQGKRVGWVSVVRDLSERKRTKQALRESEENFRILAEQSPNMIFINRHGKVVYANKKCEEDLGYTRNEFYSPDFNFLTLITPEFRDLVQSNFTKHARGEDIEPFEYTLIAKDGTRIEAILTTKLITCEDDSAILGTITDITDRKRMEHELREERDRLDALSRMLEAKIVDRNKEISEFRQFLQGLMDLRGRFASLQKTEPEQRHLIPNTLYEALVYIQHENTLNRKPTHKDVQQTLGVSRATARQRIRDLERLNLIAIEISGRSKYLTVTTQGKNMLL